MKTCSKCGLEKDESCFHRQATGRGGVRADCKECNIRAGAVWKSRNKIRCAEVGRKYRAKNAEREKAYRVSRYAKTKDSCAAYAKEYRAKNRAAVLAYSKQWREANKDLQVKMSRESREKNPEHYQEYLREYRKKNRDAWLARARYHNANRNAAKLNATPAWANQFFIEEVYRLASLRTAVVGIPFDVDHIVPLRSKVVCGLHCEQNLRVIPESENRKKSNRWWPDMPKVSRETLGVSNVG